MSDQPPRRKLPVRWLTLAETVGILALIIAALGWWDSHREKQNQDRDRAVAALDKAAQAKRDVAKSSFLLVGDLQGDGGLIKLGPAHPDQVIQSQTLVFPSQIRTDRIETTGNPRIERGWMEDGLRRAGREGPVRVPVGIETAYVDGGDIKTDRAVYVIGVTIKKRMLRGASVRLEGVSLSRRGVSGDLRAAVDAAWGR